MKTLLKLTNFFDSITVGDIVVVMLCCSYVSCVHAHSPTSRVSNSNSQWAKIKNCDET